MVLRLPKRGDDVDPKTGTVALDALFVTPGASVSAHATWNAHGGGFDGWWVWRQIVRTDALQAWRESTDSVTAKDRLSSLTRLYLYQALVNSAFDGNVSEEQDEEIWTASELFHQFATDTPKIDPRFLLAVGMTWKGTTNVFGWDGIASSLDKELRYRAAYIVAHRMLKLNKRDEALRFLKIAANEAPEGSTLKKLAMQEAMSLDP